jgi:hypothetical protein
MAIEKVIGIKVQETGLDELNKDLEKTADNLTDVGKAADETSKKVEKTEFKTFKAQLKEANLELQKMSALFGETSQEAIDAAKNVAKISDEMEFQKDLIKSYNPDDKFRQLTQTAGIATLALGGLKDGFSALGIESETLDKVIGAAQGLLGATSAISALSDAYELLKARKVATAVATQAVAVAEGEEAAAATTAAGANTALATAEGLALLPITLIVAGIAALAGGIYYFRDAIFKAIPGLQTFINFIKGMYDRVTDIIGVTSDATREFDRVAEEAKKSNQKNEKYMAEHGDQINKYTKAKMDALKRYNDAVQVDGADQVALKKRFDRESLAIDNQHTADLKKARDEAAAKKKVETDKRNAEEKVEKDKLAAIEKARLDSIAAYEKKTIEAQRTEQAKSDEEKFKLMQQRQQEELDALKTNAEEKAVLQSELNLLQAQQLETFRKDQAEKKKTADEKAKKDDLDYWAGQADAKKAVDDKQKATDQAAADAKKKNTQDIMDMGQALVANVQSLAGKNKAIQKAAIIADSGISLGKVGINTAEAITKDLAKGFPQNVPLVALDAAVGISSAAAIISNTTKALQAVGGGAAPSGSGNDVRQPAPVATAPQFNLSQGTQQGAINLANQTKQQPVKAFVVSQEMSSQQQLDLRVEKTASFG